MFILKKGPLISAVFFCACLLTRPLAGLYNKDLVFICFEQEMFIFNIC